MGAQRPCREGTVSNADPARAAVVPAFTRDQLRNGELDALLRSLPPGVRVRTQEELRESLDSTLRDHPSEEDVHVFGYGSLMWNPAIEHADAIKARIRCWHRRFCLRMTFGRGSPAIPGVMLGLDRGGSCDGLLLRIPAEKSYGELQLLWKREMATGAYEAKWVTAMAAGRQVRALAFVVNRRHDRYIGGLPLDQIAGMISTGQGVLGSSLSYFESTLQSLAALGIRDAGMERLQREIVRSLGGKEKPRRR